MPEIKNAITPIPEDQGGKLSVHANHCASRGYRGGACDCGMTERSMFYAGAKAEHERIVAIIDDFEPEAGVWSFRDRHALKQEIRGKA